MWGLLAQTIAAIATSFYKQWRGRRDVTLLERYRLSTEAAGRAVTALEWKADDAGRPGVGRLRVKRGGGKIKLPGDRSDIED